MTQVVSPSGHTRRDMPSRHGHQHAAHHPAGTATGRGRHATTQGQGFGRIVGWTILGAFVPGAGLIAAGRRGIGGLVLAVAGLLVAGGILAAVLLDPIAVVRRLVSDPNTFVYLAAGLAGLLLLWALVVVGTHVATRRYGHLTGHQRLLASLLVTSLIAVVALPTAKAAGDALIARDMLTSLFKNSNSPVSKNAKRPDSTKADPWAATPRVNVLLMGGDSGADRTGVRPDTMIVASIDTKTGDTVLISLPRNLQHVPFPPGTPQAAAFPNGFYCYNAQAGANTECLLNALWTWGANNKSLYYKNSSNAGLTATVDGIQELTGLSIDDYVMLNLRGFEQFIDAMGGLTINARERLPVGGSVENPVASEWIKPGKQHMDGYHALWYARSRWSTDDFDRMRRQRCVIGAVVQQANPVNLAIAFPKVAAAMKDNLQTSIPLKDVQAWVTLALRVKKGKVNSLAFTNQVIDTANPNVAKMHQLVQKAINPPKATPSATATPGTGATPKPTKTSTKKSVETGVAQDVMAVC